jgi:hypothetical protein
MGCSLSGRVHNLMHMGKINLDHVYDALYAIFIRVSHVQLHEQVFEEIKLKNGVSFARW